MKLFIAVPDFSFADFIPCLGVEQDDLASVNSEIDFTVGLIVNAAEFYRSQDKIIHIYFDGCFHPGGKRRVDFSFMRTGSKVQEFRTYA